MAQPRGSWIFHFDEKVDVDGATNYHGVQHCLFVTGHGSEFAWRTGCAKRQVVRIGWGGGCFWFTFGAQTAALSLEPMFKSDAQVLTFMQPGGTREIPLCGQFLRSSWTLLICAPS